MRAAASILVSFLMIGCSPAQRPAPTAPEYIPGTAPASEGPAPAPATSDKPAVLVSGNHPEEGRLSARPHPPVGASRTKGVHPLGLGGKRDGLYLVPSSYDPARPAPLMVLLHGAGRDAERVLRKLEERADQHGVIVVAIDSRDFTWDIVIHQRFGADVPFIDKVLAWAFDRWNISAERVAIAGFSDGASYALSLGLTNGDLFGQILAFSPGFAAPGQVTGKPRVLLSHGRGDRVLPVAGTRRMASILDKTGYDVRFKEFDGGHEMPDSVLDAAFSWLATGR